MDYYGTLRKEYISKEMYPTDHRVDYFPKGPFTGSSVKIVPKANCIPRFVSKIEGNAVEEGEKVFFEGIVDAQPQPIFSWYFNEEPIEPGRPGWEDAEIHDSRKMSTLILTYAREHHMGKYTLVAQNRMGHNACHCDLIVRKKQFPPVFWQRLYNYEATAGSKLIAEVEVGGWPIPHLVWYKDDEPVLTSNHTENWNGYPNKYVPERRIEVRQIDPIRHCIIFHRISESDAGLYTVVATNPLGEAICQAQFVIEPGEGGGSDLYIPDKWRTGNRLTWAREDSRIKKFVGFEEPELSEDDIAAMTARVSGVPLPRAMEYLASLPDYYPTPIEGLVNMKFKPGLSDADNAGRRDGKKGGKPSRPSKFIAGKISHSGYISDDVGGFLPMWFDENDPNAVDPNTMFYRPVRPKFPEPRHRPERPKSPPCPHVWESHDTIDSLYRLLDTVGCRILSGDSKSVKTTTINQNQSNKQQAANMERKSYLNKIAEPKKQIIHYETRKPDESIKAKEIQKFSYLNPSKSTTNTTTTTVTDSRSEQVIEMSSSEVNEERYESLENQDDQEAASLMEVPPALPPKTKIMFSPSRHLFSPTESIDSSSNDNASVQTVEYIPVKEKVKMIAQQQEEIFRREEMKRQVTGGHGEVAPPTGGVRILPPSPVTVRRTAAMEDSALNVMAHHHHQGHEEYSQVSEQRFVKSEQSFTEQRSQVVKSGQVVSKVNKAEQAVVKGQRSQQQMMSVQDYENLNKSDDEVMYVSQVSSQQSETTTMTMAQQQATSISASKKEAVMIPRLEDKYGVETHLEELQSTIDSEESFTSSQTTGQSTITQSSKSQSSKSQSSKSQSSSSSSSHVISGYSTMTQEEVASSTTLKHSAQSISSHQSVKTIQDSSYSTASFSSSHKSQQGAVAISERIALKDGATADHEVENISNRLAQNNQRGKRTEQSSNGEDKESNWVVRDQSYGRGSGSSPSISSSPRVGRRPRYDDSPRRQQDPENSKYRTPPSTPFQPGFYKKPSEDEAKSNPFPLPSPNLRKPRRRVRIEDDSDSEDENRN